MSTPWPMLAIVGGYLYFVNSLGPTFMKKREPYNMDRIMMIYNAFQVVTCGWMTYQIIIHAWLGQTSFFCNPIDYSNASDALYITRLCWGYFILKIVDLLDTVFFVLRKRTKQITFLHVYHHTGIIIGTWIGVKYFAGGHITFIGAINSFVHAVMYAYYFLTSIRPEYKNSIWWKKYITQLQMIQFFILVVQSAPTLFWMDCDFPRLPAVLLFTQNIFMLFLFYDFYRRAYRTKKNVL
ncbi:very long chain fatty acid elongase AAEL008004-like isoform X2 [Bacillus rossius redtenbacheri]